MAEPRWPSFDVDQFDRRLAISTLCRRALVAMLIVGWFGSLFEPLASTWIPTASLIGAIVGWLVANHISTRTARMAMETEQMTNAAIDPTALEYKMREALSQFTLYNTVRASL